MYKPQFEVWIHPPQQDVPADEDFVLLEIEQGNVAVAWDDITRSFNFDLPHDYSYSPEDYELLTGLQGGGWVMVKTCNDGDWQKAKTRFFGNMTEYNVDRQFADSENEPEAVGKYDAFDPLHSAKSTSGNISWSTRMLIWETTFTVADFNAADPFFLVDIPDNLEDWVEDGVIVLRAQRTGVTATDENNYVDYGREEYEYSPALKQLYFKSSQEFPIKLQPQADFTWTIRLYYYDPTDVDHTVTKLIRTIAIGNPLSEQGGLGFDTVDVVLDEIFGFDGVTPKRVRSFTWEKINGPWSQAFDRMRETGLIPRNYRLWFDPEPDIGDTRRKLRGSDKFQDNPSVVLLSQVLREDAPFNLEELALRVECWSEAIQPQNYALGATVTENLPTHPVEGAYTKVGDLDNIHDGRPGTFLQYQLDVTYLNFKAFSTDSDCIILDLGAERLVDQVHFRGGKPQVPSGTEFKDIPVYFETRLPKITVSATDNPVTDPIGVPISPDAIAAQYSPREADNYADFQWTVTLKRTTRYILIRWEQDYFFRRDGNNIGSTARQSNYPISEIRVLGDPHYRYPDGHPEAGGIPNAQLTYKGDDISLVNFGLKQVTITPAEAAKFVVGELVEFYDTSGNARFDGYNEIDVIAAGVITMVNALPVGLVAGDKFGPRKRWMLALTNNWIDLKAEKLYWKLFHTTKRLEIVDDLAPGSLTEAEMLCVERLLELNRTQRSYEAEFLPQDDIGIGSTVKTYRNRKAWLVKRENYHLGADPDDPDAPEYTMQFGGDNQEQDWA